MRENRERFRHANECLRDDVEEHVGERATVPFLCERADQECTASVEITLAEYREVRESPERVIHRRGHTSAAHENVVEATGRFEIAVQGRVAF